MLHASGGRSGPWVVLDNSGGERERGDFDSYEFDYPYHADQIVAVTWRIKPEASRSANERFLDHWHCVFYNIVEEGVGIIREDCDLTMYVDIANAQWKYYHFGEVGGGVFESPPRESRHRVELLSMDGVLTLFGNGSCRKLVPRVDNEPFADLQLLASKEYFIKVKTADVSGGGTDSDIHISFRSESGNWSKWCYLQDFNCSDLERGYSDTFIFWDTDFNGNVGFDNFKIALRPSGTNPNWKLESILFGEWNDGSIGRAAGQVWDDPYVINHRYMPANAVTVQPHKFEHHPPCDQRSVPPSKRLNVRPMTANQVKNFK